MPEHLDALVGFVPRRRGHGREANLVVLFGTQHHVVLDVGRQPLVTSVREALGPVVVVPAGDVMLGLVSLANEAHARAAPVVEGQHVGQARCDDANGGLHGQPHAHGRQRPGIVHGGAEYEDVIYSHQACHANTEQKEEGHGLAKRIHSAIQEWSNGIRLDDEGKLTRCLAASLQ